MAALTVLTGGIGEMVADGTPDVSKPLLVTGGLVWVAVAGVLLALAAAASVERRRDSARR